MDRGAHVGTGLLAGLVTPWGATWKQPVPEVHGERVGLWGKSLATQMLWILLVTICLAHIRMVNVIFHP